MSFTRIAMCPMPTMFFIRSLPSAPANRSDPSVFLEHLSHVRAVPESASRISSSMPPISSAFFSTSSTRAAGMTTTPSMSPNSQSPGLTRSGAVRLPETAIGFSIARMLSAPLRFDRRHVAREDRPVGNVEEEIAVAHAAVDDDAGRALRLRGGRHQLAPVPGLPIAGGRHHHHAAGIHALEEIEVETSGKSSYSASLRGSAAAAMVKAGPAIRIVRSIGLIARSRH